jgi:hypothetical protein
LPLFSNFEEFTVFPSTVFKSAEGIARPSAFCAVEILIKKLNTNKPIIIFFIQSGTLKRNKKSAARHIKLSHATDFLLMNLFVNSYFFSYCTIGSCDNNIVNSTIKRFCIKTN